MCLTRVTRQNPKSKEGVGYKALAKDEDDNLHSFYQFGKCRTYPLNEWITDTSRCHIKTDWNSKVRYPAGFHIFRIKRDAVYWGELHINHPIIVRVKYRKVLAIGIGYAGGSNPVVVARQMLIEKVY